MDREQAHSFAYEVPRLITQLEATNVAVTAVAADVAAITPVPAPFDGTGSDGIVGDPGGGHLGRVYHDDGTFDFVGTGSIDDGAVTYAKMQDVSATDKVLGRATAGSGDVEEIACTAAGRALLDDATAADQRTTLGVPAGSGTVSGTNTGDQTITLTGDVTGTGTGSFAATIANDAVTYAKMQDVSATDMLLGRKSSGSGDVEEIACTAAARTVLDDTTVTAMVDTLGGAAAQGSQGIVRERTPTITALKLAAGTTSANTAPLEMASGPVNTTPEGGAIEYDGKVQYASPEDSNRGVLPAIYFIRQQSAFVTGGGAGEQKVFDSVTNGTLTLPVGTYFFDCILYLTGMSGTSGNAAFDLLGAGGATLTSVLYHAVGIDANAPTNAAAQTGSFSITGQSVASICTAGTGSGLGVHISGTFQITGAGTIIPSLTPANSAAYTVAAGSYFRCYCVGSTTVASCGQWS